MTEQIELLANLYEKNKKAFSGFLSNVIDFFKDNSALVDQNGREVVHSTKSRLKDVEHLKMKIKRKTESGIPVNCENLFHIITDLCGVRVMHLRRSDFSIIHRAICEHVDSQNWFFPEPPKAYTWDPEYQEFFGGLKIPTEIKESFYTSVHYLVKPNKDSVVTCEIQVRSLFEEIWGEVDHDLNYPARTTIKSCGEQLKVLAKLIGAGTRLVDSIYSSVEGHEGIEPGKVIRN